MRERWAEVIAHDPAYNTNLTFEHGDCRLACPPRVDPLGESRSWIDAERSSLLMCR